MAAMITNGKFYTGVTGETPEGNDKYSKELKKCIEDTGRYCISNLNGEEPVIMIGSIQSGKTRAFIGLLSLCFDNDFDIAIILTKCSRALVNQTVKRLTEEFETFKSPGSYVGDVVAQDILDVSYNPTETISDQKKEIRNFLNKHPGVKRILVVKKESENVDRLNMLIEELVTDSPYKRLLIIDDEADITSIGFEKNKLDEKLISLRCISGAINTMRKKLHTNIEHSLVQVTATPYALYLQPEEYRDSNIMRIKPANTIVLPNGKGYIGGKYYFIDSEDECSPNYEKSKHLLRIVAQEEMPFFNGKAKPKNTKTGRKSETKATVALDMENFIKGQSNNSTFALPSLRAWIFDALVGASIIQLNVGSNRFYVSAVLHAAVPIIGQNKESRWILNSIEQIKSALKKDINDADVMYFIKQSYDEMAESVKAYGVLTMPSLEDVRHYIAHISTSGKFEGLLNQIDVKKVNSDNDIGSMLNKSSGELDLENSLTFFVGGQILDRGITIPNMISFFYGREPEITQQDTVMQHCRMFGYRSEKLLSVTRFYTTTEIFNKLKEITERDLILRERMSKSSFGDVVYLEAGGKIISCSPQKIMASKIKSILPDKRYLPVGFDVNWSCAVAKYNEISDILKANGAILPGALSLYKSGDSSDGKYIKITSSTAFDIIRLAYEAIVPKDDGECNRISDIETPFWFSLSQNMRNSNDEVALIVRCGRKLGKFKSNGTRYQDSPDNGTNEGLLAKKLRSEMPVLVLVEQVNTEWGNKFWWPVYYTPTEMNVGIYADEQPKTGIAENIKSLSPSPILITNFSVQDKTGLYSLYADTVLSKAQRISIYYNDKFNHEDLITNKKSRTHIECNIIIENKFSILTDTELKDALGKIKTKANKITNQEHFPKALKSNVDGYMDCVLNDNLNDAIREDALSSINSSSIKILDKNKLVSLLNEASDLLKYSKEIMGYFTVVAPKKIEIHLSHDSMMEAYDSYAKLNCFMHYITPEEAEDRMTSYVLAHEMYHAYHYAAVMTESGRWLYRNKNYLKQSVIQEALAEYFAHSFLYDMDIPNMRNYVLKIRDEHNFPTDGGYSGALILSNYADIMDCSHNDEFVKIYDESLKDMTKAYEHLLELI